MTPFRFYPVRFVDWLPDDFTLRRCLVTYEDSAIPKVLAPLEGQGCTDILCDSGAFTKKARRGEITRESYCEWLDDNAHRFTRYLNFDVMGDHEATAKNQRWMEDNGYNPVPVWHSQSPLSLLAEMMADHDYIAIGGIVRVPKPKKWAVMEAVFGLRPRGVKLHLLGISDQAILASFPAYSSDSRKFAQAFVKFGVPRLFDPRRQRPHDIRIQDTKTMIRERGLFALHGLDYLDLPKPEDYPAARLKMFALGFRAASLLERCVNRARAHLKTEPI